MPAAPPRTGSRSVLTQAASARPGSPTAKKATCHPFSPNGAVAAALVALLLFVGLAVDAGMTYVAYGQLKRAVDSAAVAESIDALVWASAVDAIVEAAQRDSIEPTRLVDALDRTIASVGGPVVLVAHSAGVRIMAMSTERIIAETIVMANWR